MRSYHNRWLHDRYRIVFHEIHDIDITNSIVRMIRFDDVLAKESIKCQHDIIVENEWWSKWWHFWFRYDTISQQWIISANKISIQIWLNVCENHKHIQCRIVWRYLSHLWSIGHAIWSFLRFGSHTESIAQIQTMRNTVIRFYAILIIYVWQHFMVNVIESKIDFENAMQLDFHLCVHTEWKTKGEHCACNNNDVATVTWRAQCTQSSCGVA